MGASPDINISMLITEIEKMLLLMKEQEPLHESLLAQIQPHFRQSATNLLHYLALRTFDLRPLQRQLSALAISSLGHSESYTLANTENILYLLRLLEGQVPKEPKGLLQAWHNSQQGASMLAKNTEDLLGIVEHKGSARIMVTLPGESAGDFDLIKSLIEAGMDIARINTGHDKEDDWHKMIDNIQKAKAETGKHCRLYMDLAGPKLRTGPLKAPPAWQQKNKLKNKKPKANKGPFILLNVGDKLEIYRAPILGEAAVYNDFDTLLQPAKISTTLPEIFDDVKVGQNIFFDDGKIMGIIKSVDAKKMVVAVLKTELDGAKLRAEKGINLPDTQFSLPSLTAEDYAALPFLANQADMIGYSFVRKPEDLELLQSELKKLDREDIGIILKIETKEAFKNLPQLIFTAMKSPKVGVMIARGDLAVEMGFERIAEVQEEIMWLCEAAHIPIIWATQVLENLAKKGFASRAEISDAAMSARAECVMLNKGPYIVNAVVTLNDIIERMSKHQVKKKGSLRPLEVARHFIFKGTPV